MMSRVAGFAAFVGPAGTHFGRATVVHRWSFASWSHCPLALHCDLGAGVRCVLSCNRRNTFMVGNVI